FQLAGGLVLLAGGVAVFVGVHDRVGGLVDHGLGRVGGGQVGVDDDSAGSVDGAVSVDLSGDLLALDGPAAAGDPVTDARVEVGRVVAVQPLDGRGGLLDSLDRVGLGDVEHGDHGRRHGHAAAGLFAGGLVGLGDRAKRLSEDPDALLALADLSPLGLPCLESGHAAGGRALHEDQHGVVEAVVVEAAEVVEPALPRAALGEVCDGGGEVVLHLLDLGGTGFAGCFSLGAGRGLAGHGLAPFGGAGGLSLAAYFYSTRIVLVCQ